MLTAADYSLSSTESGAERFEEWLSSHSALSCMGWKNLHCNLNLLLYPSTEVWCFCFFPFWQQQGKNDSQQTTTSNDLSLVFSVLNESFF